MKSQQEKTSVTQHLNRGSQGENLSILKCRFVFTLIVLRPVDEYL